MATVHGLYLCGILILPLTGWIYLITLPLILKWFAFCTGDYGNKLLLQWELYKQVFVFLWMICFSFWLCFLSSQAHLIYIRDGALLFFLFWIGEKWCIPRAIHQKMAVSDYPCRKKRYQEITGMNINVRIISQYVHP